MTARRAPVFFGRDENFVGVTSGLTLVCFFFRNTRRFPPHTLSPTQPQTMFEARLTQGILLKKVVDAVKDLVNEVNLECSATGFGMQAMDQSHVSLVNFNVSRVWSVVWWEAGKRREPGRGAGRGPTVSDARVGLQLSALAAAVSPRFLAGRRRNARALLTRAVPPAAAAGRVCGPSAPDTRCRRSSHRLSKNDARAGRRPARARPLHAPPPPSNVCAGPAPRWRRGAGPGKHCQARTRTRHSKNTRPFQNQRLSSDPPPSQLRSDGFEHYRCDRNMSMGVNMANMAKMLKCANADDVVTMKVREERRGGRGKKKIDQTFLAA